MPPEIAARVARDAAEPFVRVGPPACAACDSTLPDRILYFCAGCWAVLPQVHRDSFRAMYLRRDKSLGSKLAKCRRIVQDRKQAAAARSPADGVRETVA